MGLGVATSRFWTGGSWLSKGCRRGSQGVVGSWTGREILLSYHVQEVCSKVANFEEI